MCNCSLDCCWDFQELHEEVKEVLGPSHKLKAKGIEAGEAKLPFVEKAFAVKKLITPVSHILKVHYTITSCLQ
jgi:hypothetical protein